MTVDSISFPNLHITFPYVPKTITVFGFDIAIYGIIMASGMILAGIFVLLYFITCLMKAMCIFLL